MVATFKEIEDMVINGLIILSLALLMLRTNWLYIKTETCAQIKSYSTI